MIKISNQNYNLENTLKVAIKDFQNKNPLEMARKSKCIYTTKKKSFLVPFMGREFAVLYPSGEMQLVNSSEDIPFIWKILILHYLHRASGKPLSGKCISYKELSGGDIYFEPFRKRAILPLLKIFGESPSKLIKAAKKLGGTESHKGDYSVSINVLPCLPITYVLWKGDDEFPPNGTVLFDETANEYLHTEDIAFVASFTIFEMAKLL